MRTPSLPQLNSQRVVWIVGLLVMAALVLIFRKWIRRPRLKNKTGQLIFEIPDTAKSRAFLARNPRFPVALERLFKTANKCLARDPRPKNHLENTCFWLAHTCRMDFCEIAFLAISGYGAGATKILRSLYERAVTIEYLMRNPEKIDRFLQFAAIQEKRAMEAVLKQTSADRIDAAMRPENSVAEIRKRFEQYKGAFKPTECPTCGVKTQQSWDLDLASMVQRVGEPYTNVFALAYASPNFQIHATLASASHHDEDREEKDAETALMVATEIFLAVINSQNAFFSLNLDVEIEACINDLRHAQARAVGGG